MPRELIKIAMIGGICGVLFVAFLLHDTGGFLHRKMENGTPGSGLRVSADFTQRDTWMNVYQKNRKIGYTHSVLRKLSNGGYGVEQHLFMRLNVMGMVRSITLRSEGTLNEDFSLTKFNAAISSGVFDFKATGIVRDDKVDITTRSEGAERNLEIPIDGPLYYSAGIADAMGLGGLADSEVFSGDVFDPAAMSTVPFQARIVGPEEIIIEGRPVPSRKISLQYKGVTQYAWLSEEGEVLKEEGLLGIILERTTREDAVHGTPVVLSDDITLTASIPVRQPIQRPKEQQRLKIKITGMPLDDLDLDGGRQQLDGPYLTITKERLDTLPPAAAEAHEVRNMAEYLAPSLFIQSDHPEIEKRVSDIVKPEASPLNKAKSLMAWMAENIEKRPVLSMPDAISTLSNREGDCNEHAMLFAALARAAGIPTKIEAGLVYLDGRFFYHAWNLIYLGEWVTADTALDQIPADVTHIRLTSNSGGDPLDLLPVIGKIAIEVVEND